MIDDVNPQAKSSILLTEDGSQTLISPIFGEKYHSIHGAMTESKHVFVDAGLGDKSSLDQVTILEMGFGTGLNALLTLIQAESSGQRISYSSYEKYPIDKETWSKLKYGSELRSDLQFEKLHSVSWNENHKISENFTIEKLSSDIVELNVKDVYDIVYYDAFAPNAQEELWTEEIFAKLYDSLQTDGILVTYCAKGYVKRNLKTVGFTIESLPGPPGKREMTRARKLQCSA